MSALFISGELLAAPEFMAASEADLGAWLRVARWSFGQKNGGVVKKCSAWPDRLWHAIGIAPGRFLEPSTLWYWDQGDLVLVGYPIAQEKCYRLRPQDGKKGGSVTSKKKTAAARANAAKRWEKVKLEESANGHNSDGEPSPFSI